MKLRLLIALSAMLCICAIHTLAAKDTEQKENQPPKAYVGNLPVWDKISAQPHTKNLQRERIQLELLALLEHADTILFKFE